MTLEIYIKNEVIPVWQPQGMSTYAITKSLAAKTGKVATHTGVLDPMAEGVVIVLLGEKRFEKSKYSDFHKTYEFDITFGIRTDSYDGMGIIQELKEIANVTDKNLPTVLELFKGAYVQTIPLYSGRKIKGKKLFMYHKLGLEVPQLPTKKGQIYGIRLLNKELITMEKLSETMLEKITNIKLNGFRSDEILKSWKDWAKDAKHVGIKELVTVTIEAEMSRGLYVRSLSQDICAKLGNIGFVSSLIRTKNGPYEKKGCCTLEEVC